jgi:hypothetical protein
VFDTVEIALLKLAGSTKTFFEGCSELHAEVLTLPKLETVFRNRYKDIQTDRYHYMKL